VVEQRIFFYQKYCQGSVGSNERRSNRKSGSRKPQGGEKLNIYDVWPLCEYWLAVSFP